MLGGGREMELREISDSIYHGKSTEKKKEMNAVYYESAEFIKNNFPQKYQEMLQKAEQIAYQIGAEEAAEIVQKMRPHGQKWTREEIAAYLREKGIENHITDYYLVMNMMINDYSRTARMYGQDNADFYFNLTYDFINDEDAPPGKVARYFMN